jgi:hypothetical protein
MTRRLAFTAAVAVLAIGTLFAPGRAAAAPAAPAGLCSTGEWVTLGPVECTKRLHDFGVAKATCVQAPTPGDPDSGAAGWVTTRPDADLRPGVTGRYTRYGVGGYQLDVYDQGCVAGVTHPAGSTASAFASMEFTAAAIVLGGANGLRERAYQPGSVWGFADGTVASATDKTFRYVFTPFGVVSVALVGLWLIWRARAGNLSEAAKAAGWAVLVLVLVTAVARWPVQSAHFADETAAGGLTVVHSVLGPSPQDIPAKDCHALTPDGCKDRRTVAVRASDTAVDAVLYRNWVRAELGTDDSETAVTYGPWLYEASTLSWSESADIQAHPELAATILAAKADQWDTIAAQIKASDPVAYSHLQGRHGTDRVAAGAVALASALVFAAWDVTASLVILFGFLVFRLTVIAAPVLATVGIFEPASGPLRRLVNAAIGSAINIVFYGAGAGLYLTVAGLVFTSPLPGPIQVVAVGLAGVGCWLVLRRGGRAARTGARRLIPVAAQTKTTGRNARATTAVEVAS